MNKTLNGQYHYLSFRHEPIVVNNETVEGNPDLAIPWSLPGILTVGTHASGEIKGELVFTKNGTKIPLTIEGTVTQVPEGGTAFFELTGTFKPANNVNKIKGYFVEGTDHIVGTVMVLSGDLAKQPNGTAGPFLLFPIKTE